MKRTMTTNAHRLSATAAVLWRTLLAAGKTWLTEDAPNWMFALKTGIAGLLALWISFRLDFSQPMWALMTVFIVARKESGLVLTKGFYRILGTIAGSAVALVLVALFAQSAELFLLGLALWIGLSVALASRYRNFQSYGFMLAGYTAAIIGFSAAAAPDRAFDLAVSRVSEVIIGILCAGVVAESIFPVHASLRFIPDAQTRFEQFIEFVSQAFALEIDSAHMERIQLQFLTDIVTSETKRSSSFLESPNSRLQDARLRWMNASFMNVSSSFHGFIQAMRRFRQQAPEEAITLVTRHYQELLNCLSIDDKPVGEQTQHIARRLNDYSTQLAQQESQVQALLATITNPTQRHQMARDLAAIRALYLRVVSELTVYVSAVAALTSAGTDSPPSSPRFAVHGDSWNAALSGLRAIAVLLVLSGFWIASAWPGGINAAILGAILCILFGSASAPLVIIKRSAKGFVLGQILSFVCLFMVLPSADGFNSMALALIPFLIFAAWMIEHKQYSVEGSGVFLAFLPALGLHNQMNYDIVSFINDAISTFAGLGAALVAFSILPTSALHLRKRLLLRLGQQVNPACLAPLRNGKLRHHFESRTRDLLYQLSTPPANIQGAAEQALEQALSILEVGQIIIEMRVSVRAIKSSGNLNKPMETVLRELATLANKPSHSQHHNVIAALDQLDEALDNLLLSNPSDNQHRDQCQTGSYQLRSILRDEESLKQLGNAPITFKAATGVIHAA